MKAFLVVLFLVLAACAPALAANRVPVAQEIVLPTQSDPTQTPPFVPLSPALIPNIPGLPNFPDLMKMLEDDDDKPAVALKCTSKPCVFGYRFSDRVGEESAKKVIGFLEAAKSAGADTVMLEINTPGGSADDGHEISRAIENVPFPVVCIVDGAAYSMGMYILQSCDTRVMTKRSSLMIHQVALMTGMGARLTQVSVENDAIMIKVATHSYIEWVTHRMKNTSVEDTLKRINNGHEWFLDWEDAVHYGAVDKVVVGPPEAYFNQLKKTGKP